MYDKTTQSQRKRPILHNLAMFSWESGSDRNNFEDSNCLNKIPSASRSKD